MEDEAGRLQRVAEGDRVVPDGRHREPEILEDKDGIARRKLGQQAAKVPHLDGDAAVSTRSGNQIGL